MFFYKKNGKPWKNRDSKQRLTVSVSQYRNTWTKQAGNLSVKFSLSENKNNNNN